MTPKHSVAPTKFWAFHYEDSVPLTLECLYSRIPTISERAPPKGSLVRGVPGSGGSDFGGSQSREPGPIWGGRDLGSGSRGVAISGGRFSGDRVTGLDLGS